MEAGETRTYEEAATLAGSPRVFLSTKSPYRSLGGEAAGVVGISRDITERKRVEEDREQFVALVENAGDFIGMAMFDGRVFYVNPAGRRLVGLEGRQSGLGRIEDYVTQEVAELYQREAIPRALAGLRWEGETRFRHRATGRPIDVQQSIFALRAPGGGEPLCLATAARDMTDRKRAEEALRRAQQRLAYVIAMSPVVLLTLSVADGRILGLNWIGTTSGRCSGKAPRRPPTGNGGSGTSTRRTATESSPTLRRTCSRAAGRSTSTGSGTGTGSTGGPAARSG
jgi:PAS domain S-box-containing protein